MGLQLSDLRRMTSTKRVGEFRQMANRLNRPLVMSEGDSWFAYPGRKANIIKQIVSIYHRQISLLKMASNGDEAVHMLSAKSRQQLAKRMQEFQPSVLLFSGGGNDMVGKWDMDFFLRPKTPSRTWKDCINHTRFNRRIKQIQDAYRDLIDYRNDYSSNTVIVTHGYDYPYPSDKGFRIGPLKLAGPWMKPYLDAKGITSASDQRAIAKFMIQRFNETVRALETPNNKFIMVKTAGTLTSKSEWVNEIHPTRDGFGKIARKIADAMRPHL